MAIILTSIDREAILENPATLEGIREVAGSISAAANNLSRNAPIGITYEFREGFIRIGPRGAPAIALEFGTISQPAKRYVKRALDAHEIGG